ncbi:MAG: bifunctional diguanylate cyclase/phosphodiesterase [Candidatus Gastranaerophilales bacterium]|nr:bifunctional diguanylate cyclase/phosphodiesterase [Candidatus Gastranaerophilales bacterium]
MSEMHYQMDLLKAMNQKLNTKERMYRLLCDTAEDAFLYYAFDRDEVTTLGKWQEFFDFDIKESRDIPNLFDAVEKTYIMPLRDALFVEKTNGTEACVECMMKDKRSWMRFRVNVVYDDKNRPLDKIVCIQNISKFKAQNDELEYMAYYDGITGLYNRNYFVRLLTVFLQRAAENKSIVSVILIDIDDFKKINDGIGMVVGDELVQQFGSFLKEFEDERVLVCHMSSDIYCIAVYDPVGSRSVEHIHKQIQNRIKEPFRLSSGQSLQITVSMGVAEYPEASTSALELINCAEIVMFKGKTLGKNTIQYFNTPILNEFIHNVEIENKLKEAVFHNNFIMYFQPQYATGSRKLRGMEALIRWKDEGNHMISPATFIPIAEKNGAIIPIGNWVVEQSISQYAKWSAEYSTDFVMSINISALQYSKEDFVPFLLGLLQKYHVQPSRIELEITESILINDFESVSEKLRQLRGNGIRISLDDFGTGFSSLSYLKKFPIDTLKIDKSFIDTVLTDSATRIITESIINMAKNLGFESIAEGVEHEAQYEYLRNIGCDVIQGYLLGKPQSSKEIEDLLQSMEA